MRILVVEDHAETAHLMDRILTYAGHDVETTDRAVKAQGLCQNQRYDLLICDITMPDRDGWQLMQGLVKTCDLPAIAVSACVMPDEVRRSLDVGFSLHLTKPVDIQALLDAVERVASGNRTEQRRLNSLALGLPRTLTPTAVGVTS